MEIDVRGYKIRCAAKNGDKQHYVRLYSRYTDERLAELEQESKEHEEAQPQRG